MSVVEYPRPMDRRAIKRRLWSPPNGRQSSELEVIPSAQMARQRWQESVQEARYARMEREREAAQLLAEYREKLTSWIACGGPEPEEPEIPQITVHHILNTVARYFNIPTIHIRSERRTVHLVRARQIVMFLARELTTASLPRIAKHLGGRDHTTAMHACAKIKQMLAEDDAELTQQVAEIRQLLGAP